MEIFLHEYLLVIYGVILWQCEQYFVKRGSIIDYLKSSIPNVGRSMIWGGIIVVFDDELLSHYNSWAQVDYSTMPIWMYIGLGFCIDVIRSFITNRYFNQNKIV